MGNSKMQRANVWLRGMLVLAFLTLTTYCLPLTTDVSADAPKISGYIDTTYGYDFNKPASRTTNMRSFNRKTDTFLLNSVQVAADGTFNEGEAGYRVELDFGTDASVHKSAGTGADAGIGINNPAPALPPGAVNYNFDIQEAYLTYKCPNSGVQLKAGKFVTFEGIEVIESKDNYTISRGHLFGFAEPYTHVGALTGYAFPKVADIWIGVVNGWDYHTDNNSGKMFVAKLGLNFGEKFFGAFSFYRGAQKPNNTNDALTSFDSTWFVKPMDMLTIALQQNLGEEENNTIADRDSNGTADGGAGHWYGIGIQPKVDFTKMFSLGARYEWFSDLDGARTAVTHVAQTLSLVPTLNLTETLMARFEFRHDWTTRPIFEKYEGVFPDGMSDTSTIYTELIYKF